MSDQALFEDGSNLQAAVGRAVQERKALLCFVSDDGDDSASWETAITTDHIREKLIQSTIALRLVAGSEQATFLNAVCPVQSVPAIIIIFNGQVAANYQHETTTLDHLEAQLKQRYGASAETSISSNDTSTAQTTARQYLELPPAEGKLRLPNNAYEHLRTVTERYLASKVTGRALLEIQLRHLESLKIDLISQAVQALRNGSHAEPSLSEDVVNRLLSTPASMMRGPADQTQSVNASQQSSSSSQISTSPAAARTPTSQSQPSSYNQTSDQPITSGRRSNSSASQAQQQREYMEARKKADAERARIKAQIEADKKARIQAEKKAREEAEVERRRTELHELRKANSTTADPKASDVRIQVRMFDGSTIRTSFPAEASITNDVRPWIDRETVKAENGAHQPYNLKLIMAPLPNRSIEAGEENAPLVDLEGIKGSATMVMVPVREFTDSYGGASSGIGGSVVGGVSSVVGTGVGLLGSAAGAAWGAFSGLMGGSAQAPTVAQSSTPAAAQRANDNRSQATASNNVRVRTLADQRGEEERRRGGQLYNGMGLNVQPRKDDDKQD